MNYYLKRIMAGSFPGSPDVDYVKLTDVEYQKVSKKFQGRWRDTQEQTEIKAR